MMSKPVRRTGIGGFIPIGAALMPVHVHRDNVRRHFGLIGQGYLPKDTLGSSPQPSQDIGASTYRIAGLPFSSKLSSIVR